MKITIEKYVGPQRLHIIYHQVCKDHNTYDPIGH